MDVQPTPTRAAYSFAGQPEKARSVPSKRTIVIVGAGFSGTAVAINLLRLPQPGPLHLVLIDAGQIARGVAYASENNPHLLNVPAGRMSASSADPLEFLSFARRRLPDVTEDDFLPRRLYGDYLQSTLESATRASAPHVRLDRIRGTVIAIERPLRAASVHVHLESGAMIAAQDVVLALGNPLPAALPGSETLLGTGRYVADPWKEASTFRPAETVLIVGTGHSMADVCLAGARAAKGRAVIHAISRHGLTPARQTNFRPISADPRSRELLRAANVSLRRLVRTVRAFSQDAELGGGDWREVISAVRNVAPEIWQGLPFPDKKRFLRHVRCYWDVHRHRLPERVWTALNELRRNGTLTIHAGRLLQLSPAGRKVRVTWRPRGESLQKVFLVDRVINCTGPDGNAHATRERLLRSLIAQGEAVADPLGLGLLTDDFGALVDASGGVADNLHYIGPMLRATYWESTAVQELRVHAERLACRLTMAAGAARRMQPLRGTAKAQVDPAGPAGTVAAFPERQHAVVAKSHGAAPHHGITVA